MNATEFQTIPDEGETKVSFPLYTITFGSSAENVEETGLAVCDLIRNLTGFAVAYYDYGGRQASIMLPSISAARLEAINQHLRASELVQNSDITVVVNDQNLFGAAA